MRAVIYRRVSTGRQARSGASLDQQHEACTAYAAAQGWDVVGDYIEAGRSAYADDLKQRPQFQRMVSDARGRAFDVVLVYELSRFARRQRVQFSVAGDLEAIGVRVVSVTEPMDPDTIGGFVTYSVLAMQAELHSRLLSQRIKAVRAREAEQGQMAIKPPRGMRWEGGRLVWVDTELPRRAYALAFEGLGTDLVLQCLRDEGHCISLSSLHYLLNNPAYAGLLRHKGRLLPAAWPAIVDRAVWDAVQAQRAGRHPKNAVRATVRSKAHALLAGLAFCVNCGAKLHFDHHKGRRSYYSCSCRNNSGHCNARPSRADQLDDAMGAIVAQLQFPPEVVERARALVAAEHRAVAPAPMPNATAAERLRRLARAYADGAYTDEEYNRRRAAILAAPPPPAPAAPAFDLDAALAHLSDIPALWAASSVPRRRDLLRHLVTQVYARRHEIYAIRPTRAAEPLLRAVWECRVTSHSSSPAGRSPILLRAA